MTSNKRLWMIVRWTIFLPTAFAVSILAVVLAKTLLYVGLQVFAGWSGQFWTRLGPVLAPLAQSALMGYLFVFISVVVAPEGKKFVAKSSIAFVVVVMILNVFQEASIPGRFDGIPWWALLFFGANRIIAVVFAVMAARVAIKQSTDRSVESELVYTTQGALTQLSE